MISVQKGNNKTIFKSKNVKNKDSMSNNTVNWIKTYRNSKTILKVPSKTV